MNLEEIAIYKALQQKNEFAYLTPDRQTLYAIAGDGMIKFEHDFTGMSVEEINEYVVKTLS